MCEFLQITTFGDLVHFYRGNYPRNNRIHRKIGKLYRTLNRLENLYDLYDEISSKYEYRHLLPISKQICNLYNIVKSLKDEISEMILDAL